MDTIDAKRERETDWELTQSGEAPVLIGMGSSAASGHCVGGSSDNGRRHFLGRCLALILGGRWSSTRSAGSSSLGLKRWLCRSVGDRRLGLFDCRRDKGVVAVRKLMTPLIAIEGRRDGANVDAFSRSSVVPITLSGQNLDVVGPKVVVGVCCMLHDGRFIHPWCGLGSGKVFFVPCRGRATRFTHIVMVAFAVVTTGASVVIYHAVEVHFFEFVLGVDQLLPKCAP